MIRLTNIDGSPRNDLDTARDYDALAKPLKMTKHAKIRTQQRGISRKVLEIVTFLGEPTRRPGNVTEYRINKKEKNDAIKMLKRLIHFLDKSSNVSVLLSDDIQQVVTVYHQN